MAINFTAIKNNCVAHCTVSETSVYHLIFGSFDHGLQFVLFTGSFATCLDTSQPGILLHIGLHCLPNRILICIVLLFFGRIPFSNLQDISGGGSGGSSSSSSRIIMS
ncbi:hypothetical protein BV898_00419 [Hypsibius exemplaris]|uniref:Uncharacterized protein n=1 Tax=Hypsibius exemplaris TaxID=2072580 RepID=A0A1W0XDK2_HYPEX|nr:hypothetical protein BV898_00419 [Hypsibius exemplaris]